MQVESVYEAPWRCYINSDHGITVSDIQSLLKQITQLPTTLKDDRRSLVKQGSLFGKTVVAKKPRDKLRKPWSRLLSMVFDGETKKTFNSLIAFKSKGIASVEPLLALEKREFGRVVDSWLVYEFRDGQPCGVESLHEVIASLHHLHKQGYRHDDPNFGNFMRDLNGSMFLIDVKGRARAGRFSDYCDFFLLGNINQGLVTPAEIDALIDFDKTSLGYWLSRIYQRYKAARTYLKVLLRRKRSKEELH